MFEKVNLVGPNGGYTGLIEAMTGCGEGEIIALEEGEYSFEHPVIFEKNYAVQSVDENAKVTFIAPQFIFRAAPQVFMIITNIQFKGQVIVEGGSTVSFELCTFQGTEESTALAKVTDSSPSFRSCHFINSETGVLYEGAKGGILMDNTFEGIRGEPMTITGNAKPFHEQNVVK